MKTLKTALAYAASSLAFAAPVCAQEASPAAADKAAAPAEGEIIVTAQRRSENLQSVPVSVTALGGDLLKERRLQQVSDLVGSVPNLQASPVGGDGLPIFSLRGVSMSDFSVNQQGPVATYFDDVYLGSFALLPLGMFDLDRVEVLRGPQGTLYGKNTTGGAINFISRKPGRDVEGYLRAGYGNYDRFDAEGAVQTPLGEKAALRLSFTYANAKGWYHNRVAGQANPNSVRQYGIRASLLLEPSDRLEFVLRLSTSRQDPYNFGVLAVPGPNGVGGGVYELFGQSSYFRTGLGQRDIASNFVQRSLQRTYGAALTTTWKASDTLSVISVTGYNDGKGYTLEDTDGSPLQTLESHYNSKGHQFSQDLRLASSFAGPFQFILGGYYNAETVYGGTAYHYFNDLDVNVDGKVDYQDCLDPNAGFFLACTYRNTYRQLKRSVAVYSDMSFDLTSRLKLRGGLRYTHDQGRLSDYNAQLLGADGVVLANMVPGDPLNPDATTGNAFNKGMVTGKIGLDYKTADNNLIYASFSRGYRSSAFNAQAFFSPAELTVARPETVNAFELGFKSQFAGRKVTLNGAVFYYDYRNQQALNVDSSSIQTLINVPKSRILGGELELSARPVDGLRINASLGVLDTKVREGTLSGVSLVGNRLPNAPSVTLSGGLDWDVMKTGGSKLTLGLNGSYTAKQYFDLVNTQRIAQKGYGLVNGQISYRFADNRYGVTVWGKNLFDTTYHRYALDLMSNFGFDYVHQGDPRTYGITLDGRF